VNEPELIYGKRAVEEALNSGRPIEKLLLEKGVPDQRQWVQTAQKLHIPYQLLPPAAFDRIFRGRRHQGVGLFYSPVEYKPLTEVVNKLFEDGHNPVLLLLDGVTDVGNFGAIARSAEAMGVHALVLQTYNSVRVNADAVQASAGALLHLQLCRVPQLVRTIENLQLFGMKVVGITEQTQFLLDEVDMTGPTCLVMGDEGRGISEDVRQVLDAEGRIPLSGQVSSLNVSVATGVALYELTRQRL